ncbi:Conserved_hypothetical protein [Hexamita inflata]|uniref:Uncharacterized protein n=1 Tax=Hexamita inflata TaxID=28002 RepID=A0ABP1IKR6_9EUKA
MLQIVEQNQAASISIKQQLQRILLDKNDKLEKSINEQLQKAFISVEFAIRQNPLYVMFEEKLKCNPLTDHQSPKDVYPLFEQQISNIKQVIFTSLTGTIMLSNQLAYQNITQAYEEQDLLIYNLITMVSKHDNLLNKLELVKNEQNEQIINQLTKMKWELFKAHQQIKEKKTIGMTYLGDNMEIPIDKLSEDPAELIRKYQVMNKLYMDLQAVLQKQTDDNKDMQQQIMNLKQELYENQQKTKLNEDHNNLLSQRLKSKQTTEMKTENQDNETQTEYKTQQLQQNEMQDKAIQVVQSYAAQKQQLIEAKKKMNDYVYVGNMKRNSSSLNKIITQQQLQINVEKVEIEPSHSFDEETEKDYIFTGVQVYSYGNDNDVHLIQGLQSNIKKKAKDLNKYIPSKLEFQEITEDVQVEDKKNKTTDKTIKQRYKDMVKRDATIEVEVENMIKRRKQEQILASESLKMLENNNSQPNNTKTKITKPAKGDKFDTKQIKALVPKGKKILQNEYSKSVDFGDSTDQQYNLNLIKKLQMQLQALEQDPKKIIQPDNQPEQIQHNSSQNHIQEPRVIFTEPKKFTFTVENSTQTFDQSSWGFKKTRSEQLKSVFRPTLVESEFQTLEEQKVPIETRGIQTDENSVQLISQVQLEKIYIQVQDEIKSKTEAQSNNKQQLEAKQETKSELSEKQEGLRETPIDLKKYNESQTLVPHNSYLVENKNEINGQNFNQNVQNIKPKLNMTDIKYQTLIILQQKAVSSQGTRQELQSKESSRISSQILPTNLPYQDNQDKQNKFNKQEQEQIKESEVVKINEQEPIKQDEVQLYKNESQITSNKQEYDQSNQKEFKFDTEIKDEIQILQEQLNIMQNGNNNVLDELNKQLDDHQNTQIQNNEVREIETVTEIDNKQHQILINTEIQMINMGTQTVEIYVKPALNQQILEYTDQRKLIENPLILKQYQICSQYLIDTSRQNIVQKQNANNISSEAQEIYELNNQESQIKNIPNQQEQLQITNYQNHQLSFIQVFSQSNHSNQSHLESQQQFINISNIDQNKSGNLQITQMTDLIQNTVWQQQEQGRVINNKTQVQNCENSIKYHEQFNNQSSPIQNTVYSQILINKIGQGTQNILLNNIPIVYSSYLPESNSLQTYSGKSSLVDKEMMTDMVISAQQQSNQQDVVVNQLIQNVADKKLEIAMQEIGIQLEIQDTQQQFHEQLQKLDIREVGIQVDGKDHETDITDFSLVKQFIELQEKQIKDEIKDQYQNQRKFQQNIDQDNLKQVAQPKNKAEQPKVLLKPIKSILKSDKTIQEQTTKPEINNRSNKFDNAFKNSIISDQSRKSKDESDFADQLGFRREQKLSNQSQIIQNLKNHGKNQNTPLIQPKLQAIDNILQSPIQNNLLPLAQSTPIIKLGEQSKLLSFVQQPLDNVNKSILEAVFQQFRPTLPNPKVQTDQTSTYINNQQFDLKLEGNHIFTKNNTQFKPQNWFVKENDIIDPYGAILNSRGEILDENQKPIVNYINYIEKKQWQILQKLDEHPTVKNILNSSASIFSQRMFEKIIWQDYKKQQLQEFWRGVDFIEFMKKEHARLDKSTGIEYFERSPSPSQAEQRKLPKLYQSVTQSILRSPSELSFTSEQLLLLSPSIKNTWTNDNENPVNTSIMSDYKQPQLQLSKNKMGAKPITRATNRTYNELMTVAAREGESKTIKFK